MSIALVKIKKEELLVFKKLLSAFTGAKMRIIKDEEDIMAKLIEEGMASEIISTEFFKKEIQKHANSH